MASARDAAVDVVICNDSAGAVVDAWAYGGDANASVVFLGLGLLQVMLLI